MKNATKEMEKVAQETATLIKEIEQYKGEMRPDEKEYLELNRQSLKLQNEIIEDTKKVKKEYKKYRIKIWLRAILSVVSILILAAYYASKYLRS